MLETLVAVAILMIAIGSAFGLAPQGLIGARYARNQTTATYLAQEAVEVVHNIRDNAMLFANDPGDPFSWLSGLSECINRWCTVNPITATVDPCSDDCAPLLVIRTGNSSPVYGNGELFDLDQSATPSIFTRQFMVTHVQNDTIGRNDTEAKVVVRVRWQEGLLTNDTEVSENLFDWWTAAKSSGP